MAQRRVVATAVVALALVGVVVLISAGGGGSASFASRATSICTNASAKLKAHPAKPASVSEGLAIEHEALGVYAREVAELQGLQPPSAIAVQFRSGLAADQALLVMFRSILQRPDFVRLSLTLPGHPELVPAWLKSWLAQSEVLQARARASFSGIGLPACERALQ